MSVDATNIQSQLKRTVEVFTGGTSVYLRKDAWKNVPMVSVTSFGTVQESSCLLTILWNDRTLKSFGRPREGERFTCHLMARGVLYIVSGEVNDMADGILPRVRLRLSETCMGIVLRQHQRYAVLGAGDVSTLDGAKASSNKVARPMDISRGGFSFEVNTGNWENGDNLSFHLELFVEAEGQARRDLPAVYIEGMALVRNIFRWDTISKARLGCQFTEFAQDYQEQLEFWLTVHNCFLREL